jgi:hypothetical protein
MARGFESKAVTDQQESQDAVFSAGPAKGDPVRLARQRRLELSRVDVLRQMEHARAEGHRQMLERALAALDEQLAALR